MEKKNHTSNFMLNKSLGSLCITKIVSTYLLIYVSEPFTWSLHNIKLNICQEIIGYFDI